MRRTRRRTGSQAARKRSSSPSGTSNGAISSTPPAASGAPAGRPAKRHRTSERRARCSVQPGGAWAAHAGEERRIVLRRNGRTARSSRRPFCSAHQGASIQGERSLRREPRNGSPASGAHRNARRGLRPGRHGRRSWARGAWASAGFSDGGRRGSRRRASRSASPASRSPAALTMAGEQVLAAAPARHGCAGDDVARRHGRGGGYDEG